MVRAGLAGKPFPPVVEKLKVPFPPMVRFTSVIVVFLIVLLLKVQVTVEPGATVKLEGVPEVQDEEASDQPEGTISEIE